LFGSLKKLVERFHIAIINHGWRGFDGFCADQRESVQSAPSVFYWV
jgi:hypothetical protein